MSTTRTWRGLTLGGSSATPYQVEKESGLDDLDVRSGTRTLPRLDGAAPGPHYAQPREIVVDLLWGGSGGAAAEALTEALRAVTGPSEETLYEYGITRADGTEWFVRGRVARRRLPRDVLTETVGHVAGVLVLECPDPRIYSAALTGVLVPEYGAGGIGWNLPGDFPLNTTEASGDLGVAVNEGTSNAYPLIRFTYPVGAVGTADGVTLTNLTTGQAVEFTVTLTVGQTLVADMDALVRATGGLIVYLEPASSRYGQWTPPRDPFFLAPGTNLLRFDIDGTAPLVCRVDWRHTDL